MPYYKKKEIVHITIQSSQMTTQKHNGGKDT